jgi:heavy metal translocating P-type ATPase
LLQHRTPRRLDCQMAEHDKQHVAAVALAAIPATALICGLSAMSLSRSDLSPWIFTAGIVPVLLALLWSIVKSLMRGEYGLDIIAALSMTGALLAGEALAGVVVALMYSGGLLLEDFAQGRAQREMTALLGRVARTAQTYRGSALVETAIELLVPGDRLLIRAGEVVPADGTVESGSALLDESSLTGEALPVRRNTGAAVSSGVANGDAPFNLVVTKTAATSTYAGVVRLVDSARLSKAPMARLADRYAIGFLGVTLVLAAAAWFFSDDPKRALAVLVVATPCPLILAVPVAIVAGMSRAAKRGLLIKSARVLELLPQIKTLLIDKTGTLTDGQAHAGAVEPRSGSDDISLITAAASLAQASQHVVSQALVAEARRRGLQLVTPTDVVESPGDGVTGRVGRKWVVIGRPGFVAKGLKAEEAVAAVGTTVLAIAINKKPAGRITFEDRLRDDAPETLRALRSSGVKRIVLLTGDQSAIAKRAGDSLGVDLVIAEATPTGKVEAVKAEASNGPVMMVGDGINDAPALAAADIGVALGARGAAAASEAADIVLLVDRIDRVVDAMSIARRTRAIALQSVVVGLSLSSLGMIAAALGYLPPLAGALSQEAIDVAVILNALRALGSGQTAQASKVVTIQPEPT